MRMLYHLSLSFYFVLSFVQTEQKELPKYIRKCSLGHDFRNCVLESSNYAIPYIVKGDPTYNIPNMTPLNIPYLQLINSTELKLNLTNLKVNGLDQAKLVDVRKISDESLTFTIVVEAHNITIVGNYDVNGKVMIMPVNGNGKFSIMLLGGIYEFTLSINKVSGESGEYYQVEGKSLTFRFNEVKSNIENLFDGNEQLEAEVNKFLNENWQILLTEFGPTISSTVSDVVGQIFNAVAKDVPAENIFLPN